MEPNEHIEHGLSISRKFSTIQEMKIQFPEFPLWWLDKAKRNMEGLREIISHLHSKTETLRMSSGFRGDANEMEKQIISNISEVKQATLHMEDALESLIQILVTEYEHRPSQRIKRAFVASWRKSKSLENLIWDNPAFKVFGGLSTIAFICSVIVWAIRHFGWPH